MFYTFWRLLDRIEAKTKRSSQALDPNLPHAVRTTRNYHFFWRRPLDLSWPTGQRDQSSHNTNKEQLDSDLSLGVHVLMYNTKVTLLKICINGRFGVFFYGETCPILITSVWLTCAPRATSGLTQLEVKLPWYKSVTWKVFLSYLFFYLYLPIYPYRYLYIYL